MSFRLTHHAGTRVVLAAFLMPLLFLSVQAFGQSSATLSGTVLDSSRAVLPGATVTATNVETGVEATTVSNDSGVYTFASLQPGTYTIKAEMPGFQTSARLT